MLGDIKNIFYALKMNGRMILNIKVEKLSFKRKSCFHLLKCRKVN
jgi:hypothetical protein